MAIWFFTGFEPINPVSNDASDVNKDDFACTYMVMDPFQLVTTPNCSMSFGSLCTRGTETNHKYKTILFDCVNQNNWTAQAWDHILHMFFKYGAEKLTLQLCCYRFKHTSEKEPQRSCWHINVNARQFRYYSAIAGWWDNFGSAYVLF